MALLYLHKLYVNSSIMKVNSIYKFNDLSQKSWQESNLNKITVAIVTREW